MLDTDSGVTCSSTNSTIRLGNLRVRVPALQFDTQACSQVQKVNHLNSDPFICVHALGPDFLTHRFLWHVAPKCFNSECQVVKVWLHTCKPRSLRCVAVSSLSLGVELCSVARCKLKTSSPSVHEQGYHGRGGTNSRYNSSTKLIRPQVPREETLRVHTNGYWNSCSVAHN